MKKPMQYAFMLFLCTAYIVTPARPSFAISPVEIPADYNGNRFAVQTEQVAKDIYLLRRVPSWRTSVQANTTVIVNERDVILVDGGHPFHVKHVVKAVKNITDKPIARIITTHWHQDHNWGNYIYKLHYPNAKIISHINTKKTLDVYDRQLNPADYKDPAQLTRFQTAIQNQIDEEKKSGADPAILAYLRDIQAGLAEVLENLSLVQSGAADITFTDKLVLERGSRTIEIHYLGRANTDGDAVIWLPKEKVVITGDIIVQPTPYGFGSYPSEWADTINRILELDYQVMIPGHGPIIKDDIYPRQVEALLRDLMQQTQVAVANGTTTVDDLAKKIDFSTHDKLFSGDNKLYGHLFQKWFKTPILDSALKEALGLPIIQTQFVEN